MQSGKEVQPEQRVGSELQQAREKIGLSLAEVEQATSIYAHDLAALEKGDLEALPSRAWARGFLCSYATYLGLDGEELADEVLPVDRPPRSVRYVRRRWRGFATVLGCVVLTLMVAFASTIIAPYNPVTSKIADALSRIAPGYFLDSSAQRIVILGLPENGVAGGDNVLVTKVAPNDLGLLLIPGNTLTEIPQHGERQIGAAFTLGGPDLTRQTVARFSSSEMGHYMLIDAEGIKGVVDSLGGLQVDVPEQISGRASVGGKRITLSPGPQELSGDEALVYLQGNDLEDAITQAKRQQNLLQDLFRQALAPRALILEPNTLTTLIRKVDTNMSYPEALQLGARMRTAKNSGVNIEVGMVPGQSKAADSRAGNPKDDYWAPDKRQLPAVLKKTIR